MLNATLFGLRDTIIFRSVNLIAPQNIALLFAEAIAIALTISGYKKLFKEQLEKVCQENFLYYRLYFNISLLKFNNLK